MKISSWSLALLSIVIFSIKNHNAHPFLNLNQTQTTSSSTLRFILRYDPFTDTATRATPQSRIPAYNPLTDESAASGRFKEILRYDAFTDKSTTSTPDRETSTYNPFADESTTLRRFKEILSYNSLTDKSTISTTHRETLIYNPFTDKSTSSIPQRETPAHNPLTSEPTTSVSQKFQRNRYNFRHRFRNPVITITVPVKVTSHRGFKKPIKAEKMAPDLQSRGYNALKDYAYIETPLHSTPMVHLNITLPKILREGKVPRLASPYIIRITLARKLAARSNTTLPSRGFLRIVGSKVNMLQDGNLAMILGKIANQIGNAYNMTGRDIQGMRHVIVVGPGGRMINRRATPPKKTTVLTSPMVMTARLRIRPNCTLPKITDQIIYFEDYTKYFELY